MNILTVNAGSSSLKFSLYDASKKTTPYRVSFNDTDITIKLPNETLTLEKPDTLEARYTIAFTTVIDAIDSSIDAIAHRIVHGGDRYHDHQRLTPEVIEYLESLIPFAPLHQPFNLLLVKLCEDLLPNKPQIACFDTQFHHSIPEENSRYAIPYRCYEAGEKAYGYHGLSYEYISQYFLQCFPQFAQDNVLVAHIGSGASLCGLKQGKSFITTMGFSTLDGLPMSTRCGQIDPGLLLYWLHRGDSLKVIENRLYKESGLLGLSDSSSDYRVLSNNKSTKAKQALAIFNSRIHQEMAKTIAALGGVKHIIFTAGIGENSAKFRQDIIALLGEWLPVQLNADANQNNDTDINTDSSQINVWVIPTNEELMMLNHTERLLSL